MKIINFSTQVSLLTVLLNDFHLFVILLCYWLLIRQSKQYCRLDSYAFLRGITVATIRI